MRGAGDRDDGSEGECDSRHDPCDGLQEPLFAAVFLAATGGAPA